MSFGYYQDDDNVLGLDLNWPWYGLNGVYGGTSFHLDVIAPRGSYTHPTDALNVLSTAHLIGSTPDDQRFDSYSSSSNVFESDVRLHSPSHTLPTERRVSPMALDWSYPADLNPIRPSVIPSCRQDDSWADGLQLQALETLDPLSQTPLSPSWNPEFLQPTHQLRSRLLPHVAMDSVTSHHSPPHRLMSRSTTSRDGPTRAHKKVLRKEQNMLSQRVFRARVKERRQSVSGRAPC